MKNNVKRTTNKTFFLVVASWFLILQTACKKTDDPVNQSNPTPNLIDTWKIKDAGITWGIAIDSKGNVYTSDISKDNISKYTLTGTFLTSWGTFGSGNGQFSWPKYIAVDNDDNVYVSDEENNRIQKFTSASTFITQWGRPDRSNQTGGEAGWFPGAVAVDKVNNWFYVIDGFNRLQKFDLSGNFIAQWGGTGIGDGQLRLEDINDLSNQGPGGQMAVDNAGNIYVVDNMNFRIQKFTSSGTYLMKWGSKGSEGGQFIFPQGIAIDNKNKFIYVSDNSTQFGGSSNIARIEKFDFSGNFIKQWILKDQPGNQSVGALALDNAGNVLAIEGGVSKYNFQ